MIRPLSSVRLALLSGLLLCASSIVPVNATPLNDVRTAAAEWARLRAETTRLETEWATEQAVLDATIAGLTGEADQLDLQHQATVADNALERNRLADLTAANQRRAAQLTDTANRLAGLATKLVELRPALPPRLAAALDLPFRSLSNPELGPADRMRHTMAILNRCQQFDQTFVLTEEVLPVIPGTEPRLLEVIYLGLAQGCALDRSAGEAFIGRPVDGIWRWEPAPNLSREIARLIAVHQDEIPPEFVTLPLQITGGGR